MKGLLTWFEYQLLAQSCLLCIWKQVYVTNFKTLACNTQQKLVTAWSHRLSLCGLSPAYRCWVRWHPFRKFHDLVS